MPDTWMRTVEEVFHQACDRPRADRERFLRQRCAGDSRLRHEVESLLDADKTPDASLSEPGDLAPLVGELAAAAPGLSAPPEHIGPYRVLQPLGEGGFAEVFLAEQSAPVRRRVALKLIKPGMDSRAVLARFEAERQALAMMDHPGVARVLDAGATESGRPWFAMHYVPGEPITAHCDRQRLAVEARLELFVRVCDAIHHAHQKGLIHRDIKPSNVLVAVRGGSADPVVIDFGVAKAIAGPLTERTIYTAHGQVIGTPEYMSPEQADLTAQDVDTRSDIYSLGVLLYELLTGALPFDRQTLKSSPFTEVQRIIREVEPPRPSTRLRTMLSGTDAWAVDAARNRRTDPESLRRRLRGDLDWIVMRALDKDRTRRYGSASDLAADCRRHLAHEPVSAGPPGAGYRVKKFVRRNRLVVGAAGVLLLALVTGTVGTTIGLLRAAAMAGLASNEARAARVAEANAARQAERAGLAEQEARRNSYIAGIGAAYAALDKNEMGTVRQLLDSAPEDRRNWEWNYARARMDTSLRTLDPGAGPLHDGVMSPDGAWFAAASRFGLLIRWSAPSCEEEARLQLTHGRAFKMAVSSDGSALAATVGPATGMWPTLGVALIDARSWSEGATLPAGDGLAWSAAFSPAAEPILAVAGAKGVELWDARKGERLRALPVPGGASAVAFGPGGDTVVAGTYDTMVYAWNARTGELLQADRAGTRGVYSIAVAGPPPPSPAPGDRYPGLGFVIGAGRGSDGTIDLWALGEPRLLSRLRGHRAGATALTAVSGGRRLLSASNDRTIGVWDLDAPSRTVAHRGHSDIVSGVAGAPDGATAVSASYDGTVKLWDITGTQEAAARIDLRVRAHAVRFSPDGERLIVLGADGDLRVHAVSTGRELARWHAHDDPGSRLAIDRAGMLIVSTTGAREVRVWDAGTGALLRELRGRLSEPEWHDERVAGVAIDPDGVRVAAPTKDGALDLWDARSGELRATVQLQSRRAYAVAFSPDGTIVATGDFEGRIALIDAATGRRAGIIDRAHTSAVFAIAFTPDGDRLVSASDDGGLALWDARAHAEIWRRDAHPAAVFDAAVSPDGTRVATVGNDWTVRLWDLRSGVPLVTLTDHASASVGAAFSPDGQRLASASGDGFVLVRDAVPEAMRRRERVDRAAADRLAPSILDQMESTGIEATPAVLRDYPALSGTMRQACLDAALERRYRTARLGREHVERLIPSLITREAVTRAVREDGELDPAVRDAALAEAARLDDAPARLLAAAWAIVLHPSAPDADRAAARLAARQVAAGPGARAGPVHGRVLTVLGGAQVRAGEAAAAVDTLTRAIDGEIAARGGPGVENLALLVMACTAASDHERAAQAAEALRRGLADARWADAPEVGQLAEEALRHARPR